MAKYILAKSVLSSTPEISISEQDYDGAKKYHKQNYEAFEIELAFDFVVKNYIEIEKYIAENLVLDMVGQGAGVDAIREQTWGFMRVLNNWLSSIRFWNDISRKFVKKILGVDKGFADIHNKLMKDEFEYEFIFHLRNYAQHHAFPVNNFSKESRWDEDFQKLNFSIIYSLGYSEFSSYLKDAKYADFVNKLKEMSGESPIDLVPIIRKNMGVLGHFMDEVRKLIQEKTDEGENFVLGLIEKYKVSNSNASLVELSARYVDENWVLVSGTEIVPVRDEFISRARALRKVNSAATLKKLECRTISN